MCFGGSSKADPPAPPPAPPTVLEQAAPEEARKNKNKTTRASMGTKSLRTSSLSIGSGTGNSPSSTRSGGVNI